MWEHDAACRTHPYPELWFIEDNQARREAAAICAECPVKAPCLEGALERNEQYGIWGGRDLGASERQRRHRWEKRRKRDCEWCSGVFFWDAKPHVRPPAFCSDECEKALTLARAVELYRQRLDATG